jgi:transcriptional regulator with XRE-family HTH domain
MRMRQDPGGKPDVGDGGRFPPRVYVGANGEASAWRDEQLGQIFRDMRLTMKVSRETIARRLAASPSTIDNFEAGAVTALPHGKETERIVRGYCEFLRLDPEPILRRIRDHLQALASQARDARSTQATRTPTPTTAGQAASRSRPVARSEGAKARAPRRRLRARTLFALSAPVALIAAVVYLAHAAPRPAYRALALLPDPAEAAVRAGLDYIVLMTAPRRDGLRWIEVGDPRLRKADKLQTSTR